MNMTSESVGSPSLANCTSADVQSGRIPISDIDREILRLKQQAAQYYNQALSLRKIRNESTSSSKLSGDILRYIFKLLARDPVRLYDGWDWVVVSQVCQDWRSIAMDTREIWSNIICRYNSRKRIEMHINLSGNADLSVFFQQTDSATSIFKYIDTFRLILSHIDRVAELRIEVLESVWDKISDLPDFIKAASKLTNLHVQIHTDRSFDEDSSCLPEGFLVTSTLTYACLSRVCLPRSFFNGSISQKDLVNLKFDLIRVELSDILYILQMCSKLETLFVTKSRIVTDEPFTSSRIIKPPCLLHLRLLIPFIGLCLLFEYLRLPDTCTCDIESYAVDGFRAAFNTMPGEVLLHRPLRCKTAQIGILGDEVFIELEGSTLKESQILQPLVKTTFLYQCVDVATVSVDEIYSVVQWIFKNSNLNEAEAVQLRLAPEEGVITEEQWISMLEPINEAKFLAVAFLGEDSNTEVEFAKAIRRRNTLQTLPSVISSFLCPKLINLSLNLATFTPEFFLELEHSLRYRNICGTDIQDLYIYEAFGVKSDHIFIKDLAKCVRHLHWDELENSSDYALSSDEEDNDYAPDGNEIETDSESELEDYITEESDSDYDEDDSEDDSES